MRHARREHLAPGTGAAPLLERPAVATELLRNFSIVAHVDHGKSTLADRILELAGAVAERDRKDQFLDSLELERERGITIKASPVRVPYRGSDGKSYILNLIDTPGHVDFNYEVSRSLAACDGVVLVIDASQGVEAQTIVNAYLALDADVAIVPVINKIDLPSARPDEVARELEEVIGIDAREALLVSAKTGEGVGAVLEAIIARIPAPRGEASAPLRALVFDSLYDSYQGVVPHVRVVDGRIAHGVRVRFIGTGKEFEVDRVGVFEPEPVITGELGPGEVGWFTAAIREIRDAQVGDTVTGAGELGVLPLPGFKPAKPVVFSGLYPTDSNRHPELREALEKLGLNDAAFTFDPETSEALGFGFRCGFLGLLHAEIVQERLEREYGLELIATAPAVVYGVTLTDGEVVWIDNPAELPELDRVERIDEPYVRLEVIVPGEFVGAVIGLCQERRGIQKNLRYLGRRVEVVYEVPFGEILLDFHDRLKSLTRGYASMDYEQIGYRPGDLMKVDILVNEERVDALSFIAHRDNAYAVGRRVVDKMAEVIPRQQFRVPIQAAAGGRVIARATVRAFRKDVTAKCYGGDVTRKRKLLEKQKEGKRRLKSVGRVEIPQEAFLAVLSSATEQR
jgi:GTP-binding protein LepA